MEALFEVDKAERYRDLAEEIGAVLEGESDRIARMATVTAMLANAFDHFFWTGFYIVDAKRTNQMVVGPYQGTLGCLRIDFGRGVCGAAATRRETVIVADVHDFPDHIPCDSRSRSEIVAPVFDATGTLIAVLDVDAETVGAFDQDDRKGLEAIIRQTFSV